MNKNKQHMNFKTKFLEFDNIISKWAQNNSIYLLRFSLALVFIWFGLNKVFDISPAKELVSKTVYWGVDPDFFFIFLGFWEFVIGFCFIFQNLTRIGFYLFILQMAGTFLPMIILPDQVYGEHFFELTLEGQYIV
jgi:uncharacterized membrane protein YphA (DoxX/SURF4 family)